MQQKELCTYISIAHFIGRMNGKLVRHKIIRGYPSSRKQGNISSPRLTSSFSTIPLRDSSNPLNFLYSLLPSLILRFFIRCSLYNIRKSHEVTRPKRFEQDLFLMGFITWQFLSPNVERAVFENLSVKSKPKSTKRKISSGKLRNEQN